MSSVLGKARMRDWNDNGFLVLPGFVATEDVDALSGTVERAWTERPATVVVDDLVTGQRARIADVDEERSRHVKVNDLYLDSPVVRDIALSERLGAVLADLLGDEPVLCNTLNFDKGSQQPDHLDTLYMTPVTERSLVATWIALEDTELDAGPLRYYPGSNHIDPYRFSTGSMHVNLPEMDRWSDYMADQVDRRGLEEQRFLARKGDVFIWHALLLHGGSEICDPGLTRKSLVTHYYTASDCEQLGSDLRPAPGGFWMRKRPLAVPGSVGTGSTGAVGVGAVGPGSTGAGSGLDEHEPDLPVVNAPLAADRELRVRMEPLRTALD